MYIYLDDIFIFSDMLEEHELHLRTILRILEEADSHPEQKKCNLYAKKHDCLGHLIDWRGVHADRDKMSQIHNWRTPRSLNEV